MVWRLDMKKLLHKKAVIAAACVCAVFVAGAVTFAVTSGKTIGANEISYSVVSADCVSSTGFYNVKWGDSDNQYYFFDFKSHKDVLLTNRPNGSISDAEFPITPELLTSYNNMLYSFSPTASNISAIYRANADGSDKVKFKTVESNSIDSAVITNNKIYYGSVIEVYNGIDTGGTGDSSKTSVHVVDIAKKTDTTLTKVRQGIQAGDYVIGVYKNKLYYLYTDLKKRLDFKKTISGTEAEKADYISSIMGKSLLYEYNLDTGAETQLPFGQNDTPIIRQNGDSLYYIQSNDSTNVKTLYRYNLDTKKIEKLYSDKNMDINFASEGDYIIYRLGVFDGTYVQTDNSFYNVCFNVKTGKTNKVNCILSKNSRFWINYATPSGFICTISRDIVNETGTGSWGYISQADFFAGRRNFIEFGK